MIFGKFDERGTPWRRRSGTTVRSRKSDPQGPS